MKIVILSGRYNLTSLYYSGFVCVLAMVHNEVFFFFQKTEIERKGKREGGKGAGREGKTTRERIEE